MGNLAIAHIRSIYPDIKTGIHTFKIQICLRSLFLLLVHKLPNISSAWIFLWHIRWIKRNRISHVGILMAVIPIILPYSWHLYLCKVAAVISLFIKFFL